MPHEQQSSGDQAAGEDWANIQDPDERRRIQNKNAQRRHRAKTRDERESNERNMANQQYAGSSYNPPDPGDLENAQREVSGLPWGAVPVGRTGQNSQQSSREASIYTAGSRT